LEKIITRTHYNCREIFAKVGMSLYVVGIRVQIQHRFHDHDATELVVVTKGRGWHATRTEEHPIEAGDVFVIREQDQHSYRDTRDLALYNVVFDLAQLHLPIHDLDTSPGFRALFSIEPRLRSTHGVRSRLRLSPANLTVVCDLLDNIDKELDRKRFGYRCMASSLFMQVVGYLSRCYSSIEDPESRALLRLGPVLDHMESALDQPIRLDDLARLVNMSKSTFQRAFRRTLNTSPFDYLIRLRIQKACESLATGDQSVKEVAAAVGFDDSNYFTRQFRRIMGSSPRDYRHHALHAGDCCQKT